MLNRHFIVFSAHFHSYIAWKREKSERKQKNKRTANQIGQRAKTISTVCHLVRWMSAHNRNADSWSRFTWKAIHFKRVYKSEFNRLQPFTGNLIQLMRWMMMTCRLILRCYNEIYLRTIWSSNLMNNVPTSKRTHYHPSGWMQRTGAREREGESAHLIETKPGQITLTFRRLRCNMSLLQRNNKKTQSKRTNEWTNVLSLNPTVFIRLLNLLIQFYLIEGARTIASKFLFAMHARSRHE